jgi:dinuclear metal center YbgI/SA1388 family protein
MITLQELCLYLNDFLNVGMFKDYTDNGIQVEGSKEINRLATAVTASLATIKEAEELEVQALIVHHGLFWNGDSYGIVGTKKEKLFHLLKNDISLLGYHLPLDANKEIGNNWKAAKDLGWTNLEPFGEYKGTYLGVKGKFPKQDVNEFLKNLEIYYQHPAHCALGGKAAVESCALISGGAYKMLSQAAKEGVDCFITGNFDEPAWHQAFEENINFIALGHSATERIGPKALGEHLREKFSLESVFIDVPNPF